MQGSLISKVEDPRTKFSVVATIILSISLAASFETLILMFALLIVVFVLFQPRFGSLTRKWLIILPFPIVITLGTFLTAQPVIIFSNVLTFRYFSNMTYALFLLVKSCMALGAILILTESMPFTSVLQALQDLYCPSLIVNLAYLIHRNTILVRAEVTKQMDARKARGYGQPMFFHLREARILADQIGGLFARAFLRADRMGDAMETRSIALCSFLPPSNPRWTLRGLLFFLIFLFFSIFSQILAVPLTGALIL